MAGRRRGGRRQPLQKALGRFTSNLTAGNTQVVGAFSVDDVHLVKRFQVSFVELAGTVMELSLILSKQEAVDVSDRDVAVKVIKTGYASVNAPLNWDFTTSVHMDPVDEIAIVLENVGTVTDTGDGSLLALFREKM